MIGKIKGILKEIDGNIGLIETSGGIFFSVYLTPKILSQVKIETRLEVYTYLYIQQENIFLFGFETRNEYNLFKLLINIPGVGPKTAYSIISFKKSEEIIQAIKEKNPDFFSQIPGLGKKTIYKIILELSSKLNNNFEIKNLYLSEEEKIIYDGLLSLGYNSSQIKKIIFKIPKNLTIEEKIKYALKMIK